MKSATIQTQAIILARIDYGEADRILTVITPDHGKLRLLAKGVRKVKSKLAGGIELFSVSDISYLQGKGEIGTLVSTRLLKHYANIIQDIDRVQLGYDLLKQLHKITEDQSEADYFHVLENIFEALNDKSIPPMLIRMWFQAQTISLSGHSPNITTDSSGQKLAAEKKYSFDFDTMAFEERSNGTHDANFIKTLRLLFAGNRPAAIAKIAGIDQQMPNVSSFIQNLYNISVSR